MGNRGITRLDKTFRETATTSKEVNEPYLPFIALGSCGNMRRAYDILPLAMWQGVVSDATSLLYSHYTSSNVNSKQNHGYYTKNSAYRTGRHAKNSLDVGGLFHFFANFAFFAAKTH